MLDHKVS